jgi:NAD(P)-dependent dehydrogenase (short-subunit alcohol dehydrogenase family)
VLASFRLTGKVAVVTGGYGTLGVHLCRALLQAGAACVFVLGRSADKCARAVRAFNDEEEEGDGERRARALIADVTDAAQLEAACAQVRRQCGRLDILVNAAGGNAAGATVAPAQSFFDMDVDAFKANVDLNLMGTVLPTKIFGRLMSEGNAASAAVASAAPTTGAAGGGASAAAPGEPVAGPAEGVIVNISSMAAQRPISRVVAYSAAKSAVDSFTRWMATEMAQKVSTRIRVNAIAPGFFLADQNRRLLTQEDGSLTARGETIIKATPVGRFGNPSELCGPLVWLCSDAASFVTGIVVPVDGGFSGWCAV